MHLKHFSYIKTNLSYVVELFSAEFEIIFKLFLNFVQNLGNGANLVFFEKFSGSS